MNMGNDARYLAALGFLGFLFFTGFHASENYPFLFNFSFFSLLALFSLGVFLPCEISGTPYPVEPELQKYLYFLFHLGFLAFLVSPVPVLALLSFFAFFSFKAMPKKPR